MRWLNAITAGVIAIAVLVFAVQNFQSATVSFLSMRMTAPLALWVVLVYALGMLTGGSVWSVIRWAFEGTRPVS